MADLRVIQLAPAAAWQVPLDGAPADAWNDALDLAVWPADGTWRPLPLGDLSIQTLRHGDVLSACVAVPPGVQVLVLVVAPDERQAGLAWDVLTAHHQQLRRGRDWPAAALPDRPAAPWAGLSWDVGLDLVRRSHPDTALGLGDAAIVVARQWLHRCGARA